VIVRNRLLAVTMVEIIIVIFLFGIFLSAIGVILVQGVRAFHRSKNKLTTQQQAQLALDKLARELNESYEPGIKVFKSTWNEGDWDWDAICFPTSRSNDDASGGTTIDNGKLKWERYIIYFKDCGVNKTTLYRRVINASPGFPTDPLYPEPLEDSTLEDFLNASAPLSPRPPPPYNVGGSGVITDEKRMAGEIYNICFQLYNPDLVEYNLPIVHIRVDSRVRTGEDPNGNPMYESTVLTTSLKPTNK